MPLDAPVTMANCRLADIANSLVSNNATAGIDARSGRLFLTWRGNNMCRRVFLLGSNGEGKMKALAWHGGCIKVVLKP
jgi:hypothetical protein